MTPKKALFFAVMLASVAFCVGYLIGFYRRRGILPHIPNFKFKPVVVLVIQCECGKQYYSSPADREKAVCPECGSKEKALF